MDSQCPGCLGQAVVTLRLPCAIVESPRRHKHVPFVNIASLRSRSIKRRQWKHKLDYYGVVFAHLATGCGINAKDPSGWIQIGESRTRGVTRIPLGLKPSRDSRATSQQDSPIWIQPLRVFRFRCRVLAKAIKLNITLGPHEAGVWAKHPSLTIPAPSTLAPAISGRCPSCLHWLLTWVACGAHPSKSCMVVPRDYFQNDKEASGILKIIKS